MPKKKKHSVEPDMRMMFGQGYNLQSMYMGQQAQHYLGYFGGELVFHSMAHEPVNMMYGNVGMQPGM